MYRKGFEQLSARLATTTGHQVLVHRRAQAVSQVNVGEPRPQGPCHRQRVGPGGGRVGQVEGHVVVGLVAAVAGLGRLLAFFSGVLWPLAVAGIPS